MAAVTHARFTIRELRVISIFFIACFGLNAMGCASTPAFSKTTPGVAMLKQEASWYYDNADVAIASAATSNRPSLGLRVANLFDTYTVELRRADEAAGAWLPRAFSIAMVVLPLSGTVGGLVLPSSAATTVSTTAGSATAVLAMTSLFYNPTEQLHSARVCAAFLRNALDALGQRWNRDELDTIEDSPEQWQIYLAMRSGLDAGRHASCPDPDPPREWWTPWGDDPPEEPDLTAEAERVAAPLPELPVETGVAPGTSIEMDPLETDIVPVEVRETPAQAVEDISSAPTALEGQVEELDAEQVEEQIQERIEEGVDQLPVEAPGLQD